MPVSSSHLFIVSCSWWLFFINDRNIIRNRHGARAESHNNAAVTKQQVISRKKNSTSAKKICVSLVHHFILLLFLDSFQLLAWRQPVKPNLLRVIKNANGMAGGNKKRCEEEEEKIVIWVSCCLLCCFPRQLIQWSRWTGIPREELHSRRSWHRWMVLCSGHKLRKLFQHSRSTTPSIMKHLSSVFFPLLISPHAILKWKECSFKRRISSLGLARWNVGKMHAHFSTLQQLFNSARLFDFYIKRLF